MFIKYFLYIFVLITLIIEIMEIKLPLKEYENLLKIAYTTQSYLDLKLSSTKERLKEHLNEFNNY